MSTAIPMTKQERLTILIVHQQPLLRLGLRIALERQGMQIIGETTELEEILEQVAFQNPDVVLFDASLIFCESALAYSAAAVVRYIQEASTCGIIVLVATPDEEQRFRLLLGDTAAYELDRLESDALVEKVRQVAAGSHLITSEVLLTGTRPSARPPWPLPKRVTAQPKVVSQTRERLGITNREIEVLQCTMYGLSNAQIGRVLGIAEHTAKNHIMHLFGKFNVRDRTGAVVAALRHGLIDYSETD